MNKKKIGLAVTIVPVLAAGTDYGTSTNNYTFKTIQFNQGSGIHEIKSDNWRRYRSDHIQTLCRRGDTGI